MLDINNLHVKVDDKEILKGINLKIAKGEVHAIMGPNGTGKSTLAHTIAGRKNYNITEGTITLNNKDLLPLKIHERAHAGIFLAFQYPIEISGVTSINFMRSSVNAKRKANGQEELDPPTFLKLIREKAKILGIDEKFLKRSLNQGFSGGEKKRFEALQILLLEPEVIILDETDSGLDIDSLKVVADSINSLRDGKCSFLIITHYQRLLNYIIPDVVHIMQNGKIVKSGGNEIVTILEEEGYKTFK